ncbi:MAG: diguanylate cyclase [Ramlibacter sp.]|jgi:GGDEF domain-containing protein|nr:diguanylate cyclase [Ramlibacter sp.]
MTAPELMIWSMATGAIGAVVLVGLTDLAINRSTAAAQGVVYHFSALVFVFVLSGLPLAVWPRIDPFSIQLVQVLIGPVSSALGNYWMRDWLGARKRDRVMNMGLSVAAVLCVAAGLTALTLPQQHQLPVAAATCLVDIGVVLWLTVRATLLGDRLALGIAAGCLLMFPAVGGLYVMAMGVYDFSAALQAVFALCAVLCMAVIGSMLWQRNRQERRARRNDPVASQFDPVTKAFSSVTLIQKLLKAQRRRQRTRRHGAILALMVFDTEPLAAQAGQHGLNEMFIHLAARLHREVGVVNTVGRYYDRCFIALLETVHSPTDLRTVGLRVAARCRRPIEVTSTSGEEIRIQADIGVGIVHLSDARRDVDDLLHDAQQVAEAARAFRSRAAILDPQRGQVVPVEHAKLGARWQSLRTHAHSTGR